MSDESDELIVKLSNGQSVPCQAKNITLEILGDIEISEDVVREAAEAVAHYFRDELGLNSVTVQEFTDVLEQVLQGFGYDVCQTSSEEDPTHTSKKRKYSLKKFRPKGTKKKKNLKSSASANARAGFFIYKKVLRKSQNSKKNYLVTEERMIHLKSSSISASL